MSRASARYANRRPGANRSDVGSELRAAAQARRRQVQHATRSTERADIVETNRLFRYKAEPVEQIFENLDRIYEESMRGPIGHDEL